MSIDILQEKIRKLKNPSMVELMLPLAALPPRYAHDAKGTVNSAGICSAD